MRTGTWVAIGAFVLPAAFGLGQDSRPTSKPAISQAPKEGLFHPDPSDREATALVGLAKGKLAIDWIDREKPKPVTAKPTPAELSEHATIAARQRAAALILEKNDSSRRRVSEQGLSHKSGAFVLPLGRFEWEKAPLFIKKGESAKTAVIGVLVATATLPDGDVKGFKVKGEFQGKDGKRLCEFNERSLPASPPNGVFLAVMPAGKLMSQAGEFDGFQFRLIEVQALK